MQNTFLKPLSDSRSCLGSLDGCYEFLLNIDGVRDAFAAAAPCRCSVGPTTQLVGEPCGGAGGGAREQDAVARGRGMYIRVCEGGGAAGDDRGRKRPSHVAAGTIL